MMNTHSPCSSPDESDDSSCSSGSSASSSSSHDGLSASLDKYISPRKHFTSNVPFPCKIEPLSVSRTSHVSSLSNIQGSLAKIPSMQESLMAPHRRDNGTDLHDSSSISEFSLDQSDQSVQEYQSSPQRQRQGVLKPSTYWSPASSSDRSTKD